MSIPGLAAIQAFRLLQTYLKSDIERQAEDKLGELLFHGYVNGTVQGVIRRKALNAEEVEEAGSYTHQILIEDLRAIRTTGKTNPVRDIHAFKAFLWKRARQGFYRMLDARRPERRRLKDRMRNKLETQAQLSLWRVEESDNAICGLRRWAGNPPQNSTRLNSLQSSTREVARRLLEPLIHQIEEESQKTKQAMPNAETILVYAIFLWLEHPIELEEITEIVYKLSGFSEQAQTGQTASEEEEDKPDPIEQKEDEGLTPEQRTLQKAYLQEVWNSVGVLPERERFILLLGMRDPSGDCPLILFITHRIISIEGMAKTLGITLERFAQLLKELPLDDRRIAECLNLSNLNVRYLRNKARTTLRKGIKQDGIGDEP